MTCDVCEKNPGVGVAAVPGVPISLAYCRECLRANAHPWGVLVVNTALIGGLKNCAPWWRIMVQDTCAHLGRSLDDFEDEVDKEMKEVEEELRRHYPLRSE